MEYYLSPEEAAKRDFFKSDSNQRIVQPYFRPEQLTQRYHDTLDSLENDPQYIETGERFLRGLGEDDTTIEALHEYFRDADYNIARGVHRAFKALPNLSNQQKEDYAYLRDRFENADTGSLKQYLTATWDIGLDVASDPTAILGALLVPWTGGGSLATRQALAQTVKMGLKRVGKSFLHDKPMLGVVKKQKMAELLPTGAIDWKKTMALGKQARTKAIQDYYKSNVKQMGYLGASEGAFFTGMDDWLRQERDDVDGIKLREGLDYFSIGTSTALGTGFGWLLGAGITKAGQKMSVKTQNNLRRFSDERQLNDSDFIYRAKQAKDTIIANTIGKPVTRFKTLSAYSPTLTRLLENLRYDTYKGYEKRFLGESYGQRLTDLQGKYQVMYEDAVKPFMREGAWWQSDGLVKEDQDILLRLMRTKPIHWGESIPEATEVHKNSARAIRRLTYQVLLDARTAGIYRSPLRRGPNDWMPRRYKWSVLNQDRDEFAQILVDEDAITLPNNIVADYLEPEDLAKYQVLESKIENFTKVIGSKDEVSGEGWSSKELADLRNPGNLFKVYNDIQNDMTEILDKGVKNKAGLNVEKLRAANRIIDDMLDKKHLVHEIDAETTGTMGPSSFSPRSLWMINDESIAKFIDDDFNTLLIDYFSNSARLIARKEKLGVNLEEFTDRFIAPIRQELKENDKVFTAKDTKALIRTYKYAAGLDDQLTGGLSTLSDAIKLSQQVAHLPLATISSLTEIMIPLTRVNLSTYGKGMAEAIKHASKKVHHDSIEQLQTVHGLSTEEAYREMHRFYLGLEQAVAQRIDSLAGEGLQSPLMRKWQNVFFKTNLLSQWTRTVQLAAFTMGKDQIARNLRVMRRLETPSMKKKGLTKAEVRSKDMAEQELLDLGINITEGKRWVSNGEKIYGTIKDVRTNLLFWDDYYENEVMKGAARFANEVILDPSKSAVTRPNMQQSRAGTIFFQFLGYPTAFTNTVLKNYVTDVKRNPVVGTSKVLATSLGMTMVSAGFNALRSGGESLNKEPYEVVRDSVQRWGGLGYFEYIENLRRNVEIGGGLLGSSVKAIGGPAVGDVVDAMLYRKGLGEIVATNIPGYSALSLMPSVKAKVKGFGKDVDYESAVALGLRERKKEVSPYTSLGRSYKELSKSYRDLQFEGGEIDLPVAQTKLNPSSRIDRMTGRPYDDQAGDILKNRKGFAAGSIVTRGLTKGLSKYARQLFKGDDIVNDVLFPKLKGVLKMIGSEEPSPSLPYISSGHQLNIPHEELVRRQKGFIDDSIIKGDVYHIEAVDDDSANLLESKQWSRPTVGSRFSTRPTTIEQGRELHRQGQKNLLMSKGNLRLRNPLDYKGDVPSETFFLLYDDNFLNVLRIKAKRQEVSIPKKEELEPILDPKTFAWIENEEGKIIGVGPKHDEAGKKIPFGKYIPKELQEKFDAGEALRIEEIQRIWARSFSREEQNVKRLESLKKDYEKTMTTINKLDATDSNFDLDVIREGVLGFYTRSMYDIFKDMGYDGIRYYGSPLARPNLVPISTKAYTGRAPRLITAQPRQEGGIDPDLIGQMDWRDVGKYRLIDAEEDVGEVGDVDDLFTSLGTREEEIEEQGLTEILSDIEFDDVIPATTKDEPDIYDLEREAIEAGKRTFEAPVTTYRVKPEYVGIDREGRPKNIFPTQWTLSKEYLDNPSYIVFDSEQWMPFGNFEIPTTKEIADINNLPIQGKIDFIKENTVINTPTGVLERVLANDRPLNIIRMADDNEPMGIIHSFEEITPESLNSLRQRLDLRNPDQREAYKRLMDRYREYRGNEPGVRGIPGEGRVGAVPKSLDPIIPEESIFSAERQLEADLYKDDPLGRRMSTRIGSNLKPRDRDIEALKDFSEEELATLRRESERAEEALSISPRMHRYKRQELDDIQEDLGELNINESGKQYSEFDAPIIKPIKDEEWFKEAVKRERSEEELRKGEPVYMRLDTRPGEEKQVLVTNERNEVPLATARGMINRIKGGENSIYLHHPKDNNPLSDKARLWSILNKDHPDIVETYDLTRIPKGTTETLGKRLQRLEKERVRLVNFNRQQKQEITEIITDKGKGLSKSQIEEADIIMWIPKIKGDRPKFLRHLIKDIPDGYVKSTIYRGWLEPEGFNHAAYPDVGDIHAQMTKVTPDRDIDTKDIIEGTGDIKAWEALAKQLEDNFVEEKMAVLKIGEPQSEIRRRELDYPPLTQLTENQIQRRMAGRSEASAYTSIPRLTGDPVTGELSWTNVNYTREFIDFLKSDAVVIQDRTPTRLSSALEKWSGMAPSTLRRAEDILQGRKVRSQRGRVLNPVIDEATGKRIMEEVTPEIPPQARTPIEEELSSLSIEPAERSLPATINIYSTDKTGFEDLSNLAPRPFKDKADRPYVSVEHAYQSWKSGSFNETTYNNPRWEQGGVKVRGKGKAKTKDNWNVQLMERMMRASFEQNPRAMELLNSTGDSTLTHTQDRGIWKTEFPRILMEIRSGGITEAIPEQNIKLPGQPKVRTARQLLAKKITAEFQNDTDLQQSFGARNDRVPVAYKAPKNLRSEEQTFRGWDDIREALVEENYLSKEDGIEEAKIAIRENMVHPDDQMTMAEYESGIRDLFDTRERKVFGGYLKKALDEASIAQPGFQENVAYNVLNFDQWNQYGLVEQYNRMRVSKAKGGYEPPPPELIAEALEESPPITSFLRELNIKYANEVPPVEPYPEMTYAEKDIPPINEQQVRDLVTKSEGVVTPEFSTELQRRLPENWRFTGEHGIFAKLGVELPGFQGRKSRSILYGLPEEGEDQPSTTSFGHLQPRPTGIKGAFEDWRQTKIPSFITKIFPDISSPRDFSRNWPVHKLSSENYPTYGDIGLVFPIKATPKGVDSWFTGEASGREIPASIQDTRKYLPRTYIHENIHGGMIKAFDLGFKNIDERLRNAKGEEKEKLQQDKKWLKSYVKRYGEDGFHTPIYALTHLLDEDSVDVMTFVQYDRHPMAKEIAQNIEKAIDRRFQEVTEKVDPGKTWPMKNYRTTRIDLLTGKPANPRDFMEMVRNLSIVHAQLIVRDLEKAQDKLMPYIPAKYLKDTPFARTENERVPKAKGSLLDKASRLMERGAESFFDIGPEELRSHEREAANLVNEGIDRGLIPKRERVSIQENGRVGKVGDAFDKINHMLLAAKNTDKNLLLQGKEVVQYLTGDREGSVIDLKNNNLGVEIGRTSKNESEIRERILESFKVQDSLLNGL